MMMKKFILNLVVISAFSPFLLQCASQTEVRDLQYQLRIVNKKLEDMKANTVGQIQKRQADSSGQMSQMEQEIMTLKNQLEDTTQQNNQLKEKNSELESAFTNYTQQESAKQEEDRLAKEAKLAEISEKLKAQQESVKAIQDARVREADRRAKEAKLAVDRAKARTQAASTALSSGSAGVTRIGATQQKKLLSSSTAPPASYSSTPVTTASVAESAPQVEQDTPPPQPEPQIASLDTAPAKPASSPSLASGASGGGLTEAKNLYNGGKYQQAFTLYEQYVRDKGTGNEAVEARYMMGECLFQQKEFDQAILQYQKIIAQQAKHPKAATAMLRQAMAFEKLSDNETAKVIYQKILSSYGSSPEAAQAQEKLGKM